MKLTLIFFVVILFPLGAISQNKIDEALKNYYSQWQKGQPTTDISETLLTMDQKDVLDKLDRFTKDTSEDKRLATYKLISNLGMKSTNASTRKKAVKQLITGCNDKDGGIIGVNMKNLTLFSVQDFEPESKYLLSEMTKRPMPYYELLIKICGWLGMKDLSYDFRQAIEQKKGTVKQRWAMRLAMARMGETEMLDYCVQRVTKIPVNDDVVYELVPDMIYTRQKSMFDYLFQIIESDEKKCSSPNPDSNAKILCAYGVIEQIAPYIENFPAEISASGDLKTKDYEKALQDVRAWIKQNKESYAIKKEEF
jgi:hypothetical protein